MSIKTRLAALEDRFDLTRARDDEPTVTVELPNEWWAEEYKSLSVVPISALANIEKIYGAEARLRNESPLVTMLRYAAHGGKLPPVEQVEHVEP